MASVYKDYILLKFDGGEGETLYNIQHSPLWAIEKVAGAPDATEPESKMAVFVLSELLRDAMLTKSQLNQAIGRRPYKKE